MNGDGSQQTRLTFSSASEERAPSISPDGRFIAFTSTFDGDEDIWVINADGTNPRQLTNSAGRDFRATWSADSQRLTFVSERDGNGEIYTMSASGANQTRLTNDATIDTDPVFSPNGQLIAYASGSDVNGNLTGYLGLYTINVSTRAKQRISGADGPNQAGQIQHIRSPNWSPDGQRIVFEAGLAPVGQAGSVTSADLYSIAAGGATSSLIRLTNTSFNEDDPAFSPDNTRVTFRSNRDGNSEIYSMSAMGPTNATPQRLTNNPAADEDPWWGRVVASSSNGCVGTTQSQSLQALANRTQAIRQNADNSTLSFAGELYVGDHDINGHKTFQSFLGFRVDGTNVPLDPNKICSARIVFTENRDADLGTYGQPFSQLGNLFVERIGISEYGSLNLNAPDANNLTRTSRVTAQSGAAYSADVTNLVKESLRTGQTEAAFRLRFQILENNDGDNDYAAFISSGTSQPRLVVTFSP